MCVPRVKISILSSNQTLSVAFRMFDTDTEIIASWPLVGPNLDPELFMAEYFDSDSITLIKSGPCCAAISTVLHLVNLVTRAKTKTKPDCVF
jgi:hypothetical protein